MVFPFSVMVSLLASLIRASAVTPFFFRSLKPFVEATISLEYFLKAT
jgi:hypothetical protein